MINTNALIWIVIAWLMIAFFFLGSAAGIMNVYRAVNGLGLAPGYKRPDKEGRE